MAIGDLTRSVAEMGINESGVRQMAEANASEDMRRVARTATVLRRVALLLGLLGAGLLAIPRHRLPWSASATSGIATTSDCWGWPCFSASYRADRGRCFKACGASATSPDKRLLRDPRHARVGYRSSTFFGMTGLLSRS